MASHSESRPLSFGGRVGVARRDITPPIGIYNRLWGASKHDVAESIHRPMTVTAIAMSSADAEVRDAQPLVLVSVDLSHIPDDGEVLRDVLAALKLDRASLMIACTHTHSSPWLGRDREALPGGEMLPAYRDRLIAQIVDAARAAIDGASPATITWATGRCALATNRDLPDPHAPGKSVCGFNPANDADDTLLVGRITRDSDDAILGTIVNYACHPTTLGWDNRAISPDYIGAMRELVEHSTGGAPCAFVQGASGELGPALQYHGDHAIADRYGRALGHAVLSTIELMLPPRHELYYEGRVESGTPLGMWRARPFAPPTQIGAQQIEVPLPLKSLPSEAELTRQLADCHDRVISERLRRRLWVRRHVGARTEMAMPMWTWRVGDALLVGLEGEPYSIFQQSLRTNFPDAAVVAMNVVNSSVGYVYPSEMAGESEIYQVWQSPFSAQAMPRLIGACESSFRRLLNGEPSTKPSLTVTEMSR